MVERRFLLRLWTENSNINKMPAFLIKGIVKGTTLSECLIHSSLHLNNSRKVAYTINNIGAVSQMQHWSAVRH